MKRALSVFSVLLIVLIASASTVSTRYYLTDLDFISDQPVPESATRFKPHISADYDEYNHIIKKLNIDRKGEINQTEIYSYDSLGDLRSKDIYLSVNELDQQVLFGMESKAVDYIEYVYGVDTVKDWTDRFSILDYNDLIQLTNHAFFDVNAFQYGNAHYEYDSLGYLSKEEWIRQPSGKTMRWWNHYFDPATNLTRIMEYDSNGVLVQDFRLSPDGTELIFWFTDLNDSTYVNQTNMSFKIESYLKWGKVIWYRLDASGAYVDSVQFNMSKRFLQKGSFETNMGLDSALVDSAMYDIVFKGKGKSGYDATQRKILGVTFDISPPIMDLFAKPFINEPKISYDQSEDLAAARIEWHAIHDSSSIISVEFDSSDLSMFGGGLFKPLNQVDLQDSIFYRVEIYGIDFAGNVSFPAIIDSIMFDITLPGVEVISPLHSEYRNFTTIDWTIDEPIQSWKMDVKSIAGKPDYYAPHSFQSDSSLFMDVSMFKELSDEFQLNDGTVYRFELSVIDRAGNTSTVFEVDSVTYDITPPLLTTIYPATGDSINITTVSYSINEPLRAGEFRWEQTEGTMDSSAPHIIPLIGEELHSGDHIQIQLNNQSDLKDGSVYTLLFAGMDRAGNVGEFLPNTDILFDAMPPEFTDIMPYTNSALNHQHISYTLSEKVNTGSITWSWIGGVIDNAAPHRSQFLNAEYEGGVHDSLLLSMNPPLVDGGIYNLEFNASDRAGNIAETYYIENVLYDFTSPVMSLSYPSAMSFLPNKIFQYTLSENIEEGEFLLERKGGKEDPKSPYIIRLTTKEKSGGIHENVQLLFMPDVVEGSIYKLSFKGFDRAGNYTFPITLPGIQYDFRMPELTLLSLPDSTDINYLFISYDLSEILKEADITWERTGGAVDSKHIHKQSLLDNEMLAGVHIKTHIFNTPNLTDGSVYSISISGKDRAGNESNISIARKIRYDITAPEIEMSFPFDRTYITTPAISYSLNEKLSQGKIIYNHMGGASDPNAPYEYAMDFGLRQKREHRNIFMDDGPDLMEGGVYSISITGRDRAGNEAEVASVSGVIYDATSPKLTIQTPDSTLVVNHNRIRFSKNEDLASGTITWSGTGGKSDPSAPYRINLTDIELIKGVSENYTLSNTPQLMEGTIYDISFSGIDYAGNESENMVMSGVLYDISPPLLKIVSPGNNHFTNGSELTFFQSEDLDFGQIIWDGIGEDDELLSTHWELNKEAKKTGEHELNNYYEPLLVDGGDYSIQFEGRDPAGNEAQPVKIIHYNVDRTPPIFSNLQPANESYVNLDYLGYMISENIESGIVVFSSKNDKKRVPLFQNELLEGMHPLGRLNLQEQLIDGEVYKVEFYGIDFAGNESDTVLIHKLTYDISPPILIVQSPESNSHINKTVINLSIDEQLLYGRMIWEPDVGTLVMNNLITNHIQPGEHRIEYEMNLDEQIPYSIYIEGTDLAGNSSKSESILNVLYDITPPEIAIQSPMTDDVVNHKRVSYSMNENLLSAKMVWQDISQIDPKPVHESELKDDERLMGIYNDVELTRIPGLFDGAQYMLRLEGVDLAGNTANTEDFPTFKYDITPPEFTQLAPSSGSLINEVNIDFTNSEDMLNAKISFTQVAGVDDPESPHIVNLVGSRLNKGTRGGRLPESIVTLMNGSVYNVEFFGVDFAGNVSKETRLDSIRFDNEPPVVFLKSPSSNGYTNSLAIDYLISEDLTEGILKIKIKGEKEISIELNESYRKAGDYSQFLPKELLDLEDGIEMNITLTGKDAAGNISLSNRLENVKYDTTHPIISIIEPITDAAVKQSIISLNISEDLSEGFLIATQTGGVFDSRSPHRVPLLLQEIKLGEYEDVLFTNGPRLQNGSIYTFEFSGKDFAGNEAKSSKVTNVLFDNEPPVVSLSKPIDSEQIKTTEISFVFSDNLSSGLVTFEQTGGTTDLSSPHVVELTGSQLKQGPQLNIDMKLIDILADGARYKISIQGVDRAGNESQITSVKDVLFDVLPPFLAIHEPVDGSAINEPIVSFEMNEKLAEGTFIFVRSGGNTDANSPHTVLILPPFNDQGRFDGISLANDVTLQNGSEYTITFNARDPAGNVSIPVSVSNIFYDITAPVIETTAPLANSYLRNMNVNYRTDEQLVMGQINIMQTLGTSDLNSPHLLQLKGDQLIPGEHQINVLEQIELVSGAEYAVQIFGQDRAGNYAAAPEIEQLIYDIEPPDLEIFSPLFEAKVNTTIVGFSIGEKLQDLSIKWLDKHGAEQLIILPEKYYLPDKYNQVILREPPILINGSTYSIVLTGTDLAENSSEVKIEGIIYDITPPNFTGISPSSGSFINHTEIQFTIDEPLQSGRVLWKDSGGKPDLKSPRSVELVGQELMYGMVSVANLTNQIKLNDGTIYELSVEGTDIAGNTSLAVLAVNITYDISPPLAQLLSPDNDAYVNHVNASFSINENLKSGKITWQRIGGEIDPIIHVVELKGDLLKKGIHDTSGISDLPLVSMVDYLIEITGVDLAGNTVLVPSSKSIHFDTEPPELTIDSPTGSSSINHLNFNFTVSEPIQSGEMIYTDENDIINRHYLSENELKILVMTEDPLTIPMNLKDGSTYSFKLSGIDYAGNSSESPEIKGIHYDISKPLFIITRPKKNYVNVESITSYTLNEDIVSGTATWVRTGGKIRGFVGTANRPQIMELIGNEMLEGDHKNILFTNSPQLNATTIYKLTLQGIDAAGNESLPASVDGIEFIPAISGNWFFQGSIMTVVWTFEPDEGVEDQSTGTFSQGIQMGTKISNQEKGRYKINFSKTPWEMTCVMNKSGLQRYSIFEFRDNFHMKVLTKDRKKPKNWRDGEIMLYEYR